jgi:hypothetical protein
MTSLHGWVCRYRGSKNKIVGHGMFWLLFLVPYFSIQLADKGLAYCVSHWQHFIAVTMVYILHELILFQWAWGSKYFPWDKDTSSESGYAFAEVHADRFAMVGSRRWKLKAMKRLWEVKSALAFALLGVVLVNPLTVLCGWFFGQAVENAYRKGYSPTDSGSQERTELRIGTAYGYFMFATLWCAVCRTFF